MDLKKRVFFGRGIIDALSDNSSIPALHILRQGIQAMPSGIFKDLIPTDFVTNSDSTVKQLCNWIISCLSEGGQNDLEENLDAMTVDLQSDEDLAWFNYIDNSGRHSRRSYKFNLRRVTPYLLIYACVPCDFSKGVDDDPGSLVNLAMNEEEAVAINLDLVSWVNYQNNFVNGIKVSIYTDDDGDQLYFSKDIGLYEGISVNQFVMELQDFIDSLRLFTDTFDDLFS